MTDLRHGHHRRLLAFGLTAALMYLAFALPAAAASLAIDGNFAATNDPNGQDLVDLSAAVGPLVGTVSAAGVSASGIGEASGQASASAEYGRLRAQASGITFGPFPDFDGGVATGSIRASWTDVFTIAPNQPALMNQPGTFVFAIQLSGSLFANAGGADFSNTRASYSVGVDSDFCGATCSTSRFGERDDFGALGGAAVLQGEPIGNFTGTAVDFIFGVPLDLTVSLTAISQTVAGAQGFISTASANLGSTLHWGGFLEVRDGENNLVNAYSVTSESGVDWSQPVPEPSPLALVLTGLAGLGVLARSRLGRSPTCYP